MELVKELEDKVELCIEDQHGNHVIQKMIESLRSDRVQFIF